MIIEQDRILWQSLCGFSRRAPVAQQNGRLSRLSTQRCAKTMPRRYRAVYLRHAHRTCRPGGPAGGRSGFNEDRRICPIKTSYKDPSGSTFIRKTSNLNFAAAASSYPRAIQAPTYRYPSRYRYRAPPFEPSATRGAAAGQTRIYGTCFECRRYIRECRTDSTASSSKTQLMIEDEWIGVISLAVY